MFDERNPNNLIEDRRKCGNCCDFTWKSIGILIVIAVAIVPLHYIGTYLVFGFVVAGSPNNNRITGCPDGVDNCDQTQKMLCYQENMSLCHQLGFVTLIGLLIVPVFIFLIIIKLNNMCICIYDVTNNFIQSYKMASNMAKNSEDNYDVAPEDSKLPTIAESSEIINVDNDGKTTEDIESIKEENVLLDAY